MTAARKIVPLRPVHFSQLKHISASPAHYQHRLENPPADTPSYRLGRAVDKMLLGRPQDVVVYPGQSRKNKGFAEFAAKHASKEILLPEEADRVRGMVESLLKHPRASRLLRDEAAVRQQTIRWKWLGRECEGTPDAFGWNYVADLKTDICADPRRFVPRGRGFHYHCQLWWYRNGLALNGLVDPAAELWSIAVESRAPYPVQDFYHPAETQLQAEKTCRAWLEQLLVCEASGSFPAYSEAPVPFDMPRSEEPFSLTIDGEETEIE